MRLTYDPGHRENPKIDDYAVEVTLSLALAAGVYAVAQALGISGPIAVVAAGADFRSPGARSRLTPKFWLRSTLALLS